MASNNAFQMLCWASKNDVAVGAEDYIHNIITFFSGPGATIEKGGQHLVPTEDGTLSLTGKSIWLHVKTDEELHRVADIIIVPPKGTCVEDYSIYICLL